MLCIYGKRIEAQQKERQVYSEENVEQGSCEDVLGFESMPAKRKTVRLH